ncbi:MAG: hypothetical protein UW18_C0011G0024 [Microgenomates group bacterium GW2011_GWF1_44_10]|nr:MAG: hypothetical protein UW18_C0011G0024 [Microgenomates group bacterium GW2011_GWF1_44_10]
MGAKWARKIQWGTEVSSAIGTKVAATSIVRGVGVFEDDDVHNRHVEDVNLINGTTDSYVARRGGKLSMDFDPISFEQITDVLQCGIVEATASVDGAGTGQIWVYPFPTASSPSVSGKSLEFGDDAGAEVMDYSIAQSITLTGSPQSQYTCNVNWYGRKQDPQAFTALTSSSIPVVNPMLFGKTKLYIDAIGGTIGSTLIDCTVLGLTLNIDFGLTPKWCARGSLEFGSIVRTAFVPRLTMSLEYNTTSIAEKVFFRAGTARKIRLTIEGASVATAGTTYTYKTFNLDLAGYFERVSGVGELDGNNTIDFEFVGAYSDTAGIFGEIIVVNELATIP